MSLSNRRLLGRVAELADPSFICELLNITTEQLLEQFDYLVEENIEALREVYDVNLNYEMEDKQDG